MGLSEALRGKPKGEEAANWWENFYGGGRGFAKKKLRIQLGFFLFKESETCTINMFVAQNGRIIRPFSCHIWWLSPGKPRSLTLLCQITPPQESENFLSSQGNMIFFAGEKKQKQSSSERRHHPNENLPLGTSVFREFFSNLTEVLIFFKMSKKRSNYESSVYLRIYVGEKKVLFWFLASFDKNTGHKVTKIYPVSRISITYKSYLIKFFLSRKKYFDFFYIHYFKLTF